MLVEDDQIDVMNVKRAFDQNNVQNPIHVATNGLEALALLRNEDGSGLDPLPRIIILDINMPKMNGIEFLREIRKDDKLKNLTVIVMTTSKEDADIIEAYELNVAGYVVKPLSFERFREAIGTIGDFLNLIER